jgi:hypothetical protein
MSGSEFRASQKCLSLACLRSDSERLGSYAIHIRIYNALFKSFLSLSCVFMSRFAGNVTFANVFAQPSQWGASNNSLTVILIALSISILSIAFWPSSDDKIHKLEGFHLVTLSNFFSKRYDFFQKHFKTTGLKMFRFNVLQVSSYTGVQF